MKIRKESGNVSGVIIGVIVVVAVGLIAFLSGKKKDVIAPVVPETTSETETPNVAMPQEVSSMYKDGVYSATGKYTSPFGIDQVGVKVTLANDIVTDVSLTTFPSNPKTEKFQGMFATEYKQYVIGKNISEIKLGKVSGSSLTGAGFNDALEKIKLQSKA